MISVTSFLERHSLQQGSQDAMEKCAKVLLFLGQPSPNRNYIDI